MLTFTCGDPDLGTEPNASLIPTCMSSNAQGKNPANMDVNDDDDSTTAGLHAASVLVDPKSDPQPLFSSSVQAVMGTN